MIVMRRCVEVDGKVRTDVNYPAGFQDVIRISKTGEQFRLMYDVKGRFHLYPISSDEASFKLCRVQNYSKANKSSIGRNPFLAGQAGTIPYITTHDGRTIRYPDPLICTNDTIKLDLKTGKVAGILKFEPGNMVMVTRGANIGRIGFILSKERHPGSFDIVHLRDKRGNDFATRLSNVFVIGDANKAWITLPKQKGIKLSIQEERTEKTAQKAEKALKKAKRDARDK
jgi:small subunit ribosomal protein S4e